MNDDDFIGRAKPWEGEFIGRAKPWEGDFIAYVTGRLPVLRRVATQLAGDAHRGDDLVQQAITRLYTHWRRVAGAENLDAYVYKILLRVFLDERRLRWASVRLGPLPPGPEQRAFDVAALGESGSGKAIVVYAGPGGELRLRLRETGKWSDERRVFPSSPSVAHSGPSAPSRCSRSARVRAGLAPPEPTATVSMPRRTTPGR